MKKNIILTIISIMVILVSYYMILPPINMSSPDFWSYLSLIIGFIGIMFTLSKVNITQNSNIFTNNKKQPDKLPKVALVVLVAVLILPLTYIINFFGSPLFVSQSYYERISVDDANFDEEVNIVDTNNLALLDKESSLKLGDRVMGQLTNLVSQFYVSDIYTQISNNDTILRVTPLEYDGLIKYFSNKNEGVPGYITVNSVSGESNLVELDSGMKYMPSAYFDEDLNRKLRFSYPFENFGEITFEIDDEGNPYWVVPTVSYSLVGLREEATGVIILNPVDGTSVKYSIDEVPSWVDHVYNSSLVIEQLNDWGTYKNGFWNSIFGQKEVVMTTEGYNYLSLDGDTYLYTGITSVASDESNIGFVMVNLRTKETNFYQVSGAEEYSAMESAKGQVQHLSYSSTFPLLINLEGSPTYLMSLKDNAGLVKMYALVDYSDYQKVVVTDSSLGIDKAIENYLGGNIQVGDIQTEEITIDDIKTGVIDGNTYYYIKSNDVIYTVQLSLNPTLISYLEIEDKVTIKFDEEKNIKEISK